MSQDLTLNKQEQALDHDQEGTWQGAYAKPAVDIFEAEDGLTLVADLPGIKRDDITLDLNNNTLTITARTKANMEPRWRALMVEAEPTHFMRQFKLSDQLDQDKIQAKFSDGVLTLKLPKSAKQQPKQIAIS